MKKIYTFGDGYASSHIWPEWPVILEALLPSCNFTHYGAVGAGNEYISNAVIKANIADPNAFFLVQWTMSGRFDKLLEDSSWDTIINTDPVYSFNRNAIADQTWWISSASTQPEVRSYHAHYVQALQSQNRTLNYIYLASSLLKDKSLFFSTLGISKLVGEHSEYFENSNLIKQDMHDFGLQQRFELTRQKEVQPSPVVHLAYVKEYLLPKIPFAVEPDRLSELESRIHSHRWIAYDPDREEIWQKMSNL